MTRTRRFLIDSASPVAEPYRTRWDRGDNQMQMVPMVVLVGIDELDRIPSFLDLGSVVVVAPDTPTFRRWQREQHLGEDAGSAGEADAGSGVLVDMDSRRVSYQGVPLRLSEMEFRVLASFLNQPGKAFSFEQIRKLGWQDAVQLPIDIYAIRSSIQRLRAKLHAVNAPVTISAVRSFGFRLEPRPSRDAGGADSCRVAT